MFAVDRFLVLKGMELFVYLQTPCSLITSKKLSICSQIYLRVDIVSIYISPFRFVRGGCYHPFDLHDTEVARGSYISLLYTWHNLLSTVLEKLLRRCCRLKCINIGEAWGHTHESVRFIRMDYKTRGLTYNPCV